MARSLFPIGLAVALALAVTMCTMPPQPLAPRGPVQNIEVRVGGCATDQIQIVVRPWEAHVRRGDPLSWTLDQPTTGIDSMVIVPKADWPFTEPRPSVGRPQMPARAGNVRQDAPMGHYSYSIMVYCDGRVIDIDPEIVIRDPMGPG
jgi:hypothetical protein